jgi:hypothetical protein
VRSHGKSEWHLLLGGGNDIVSLEDLQTSPSRPSKNRVKVETLERLEAVA